MSGQPLKNLLAVSDFNLQNFCNILNNAVPVKATCAPFGQVYQSLNAAAEQDHDYLFLWIRPQEIFPSLNAMLKFEQASEAAILDEAASFFTFIENSSKSTRQVFICQFSADEFADTEGSLSASRGLRQVIMKLNLLLLEYASRNSWIVPDPGKWFRKAGAQWENPKLWHMAKIPFSNTVFAEAAKDLAAEINAVEGRSKKVIVCDLDDTLWGGIVGDDGWKNLRIGGHDPEGEAYKEFQQELKRLKNRGILLCIVSKNTEDVALEALQEHPEMLLRIGDFAAYRINWEDKASNIAALAAELNLGLDSFVFIDDNIIERERVKAALPQVLVPEWPKDKLLYSQALRALDCFRTLRWTGEDQSRTSFYAAEKARSASAVPDMNEWLGSLGTTITIEPLSDHNIQRANQLLNKTNQMNLTTRRMSEKEMKDWAASNHISVVKVSDKFGDSGLTGLIGISVGHDKIVVEDFVLSCRVMGRGIEKAMLHFIGQFASEKGIDRIYAKLLPTGKNQPVKTAFDAEPAFTENGNEFINDDPGMFKLPPYLSLHITALS